MQEQMKTMNDSGDFQDVELNYSGRLSHVSSQLVMILSSRFMLGRDKRLPIDTYIQSRLQKNVFGNQFLRLIYPQIILERIQYDNVQRNRGAVPGAERTKTAHTSEDRLNQGTIPMPTFATKILAELTQNYVIGQQRQQKSELKFDKFPNPPTFF